VRQWRNLEDRWNLANTLGELADLHLDQGKFVQARACLDKACSLVEEQHQVRYASLKRELAERRQKLRRLTGWQ
jgi:hypothetical protein